MPVGAAECNEAAIYSLELSLQTKDQDQKIVRTRPEPSPASTDFFYLYGFLIAKTNHSHELWQ
jgi:hypothetical protein